jgi:U3 small nucleolar RNA-associated protein 21
MQKKAVASSLMFLQDVCVTACGNFGLAGSSTGLIHMWNMQSGIKRKSYDVGPCPPEASTRLRNGAQKRDRVVTGLATDPLNRIVIASTFDGTLNVSLLRLAQYFL